jgi:DNA replication protein DnaC
MGMNIGAEKFIKTIFCVDCVNLVLDLTWEHFPERVEEKRKDEEKRRKEKEEWAERNLSKLLASSEIPQNKIKRCTLKLYKTDQRNTKAIQQIEEELDMDTLEKSFLTICGANGLGKTHLAIALAVSRMKEYGQKVKYYPVSEMLEKVRASYNNDSHEKIMNDIKTCNLLILDDFGVQKSSDFVLETLDNIIDSRYENELDTVVVTNLSITQINEISPRIASRLLSGNIITLHGEDYRKSQGRMVQ